MGKNNWLSTGDFLKSVRLCKDHIQVAKVKPYWGKTANAFHFKKLIMCCTFKPSAGTCAATAEPWTPGDGRGTKEKLVGKFKTREECVCAVRGLGVHNGPHER